MTDISGIDGVGDGHLTDRQPTGNDDGDDHEEGHKAGKDDGHGQASHNRYRCDRVARPDYAGRGTGVGLRAHHCPHGAGCGSKSAGTGG